MVRQYSFILILVCWITGLGWWANRVESASEPSTIAQLPETWRENEAGATSDRRIEVIELLDRIVAYEHYYRSVYGHFTQILNRVGMSVPASVSSQYAVTVVEAAGDRLLVTAVSELGGKVADQISIDQDFRLRANFSLPPPRPDYLKALALKQLRQLRDAPEGRTPVETGVFRDYFRYDVRNDANSRRVAFAVGVRPPVVGLQLELAPGAGGLLESSSIEATLALEENRTGQKSRGDIQHALEQAYLAQQIFRGEMGRYARSWGELSQIADFRFEGRNSIGDGEVPFRDGELSIQEIDISKWDRDPAGAENGRDLIVEPIEPLGKRNISRID